MSEHPKECAWHVDQYPWECTCGLVYRQHRDHIEQLTAEVERLREALGRIMALEDDFESNAAMTAHEWQMFHIARAALAGDSHEQ